jgi:RHS repeat-associated protein
MSEALPECKKQCQDPELLKRICSDSCATSCMQSHFVDEFTGEPVHGAEAQLDWIYGQTRDLNNNIVAITDGAGRTFVSNEFGQDPTLPSFDAVVEQHMGNDDPVPMRFSYRDFDPPPGAPVLVETNGTQIQAHAPDGTDPVCSWSSPLADILRNTVLIPLHDPAVLVEVGNEPCRNCNPLRPDELAKLNADRVGLLEVLDSQTLRARGLSLPESPTLMMADHTLRLAKQADGLYLSAEGGVLDRLAAGQMIAFAREADTLRVVGTAQSIVALSSGSCSTAFSLEPTPSGSVNITPASACQGDLRLIAVAAFGEGGANSPLVQAGAVDMQVHASETGTYRLSSAPKPSASEWMGAVERVNQGGANLVTLSAHMPQLVLPDAERDLAEASRVLSGFERLSNDAAPAQHAAVKSAIDSKRLELVVAAMGGPQEVRAAVTSRPIAPALTEKLELASRPSVVASVQQLGTTCQSGFVPRLRRPEGPGDRARAASGTRVTRADGTEMVAYYNAAGDAVRIYEPSRGLYDDFQWSSQHDLVGKVRRNAGTGEPLTPHVCASYNDRGLATDVWRFANDDSGERSGQCFAWDDRGPWLTGVSAPSDAPPVNVVTGQSAAVPVTMLESRSYDDAGRIRSVVSEGGAKTTFDYDQSGRLIRMVAPDGSVTDLSNHDPFTAQPQSVIRDALGAKAEATLTYDPYGHITSVDRHGWGPSETWTWEDRVRMTRHTVSTRAGTTEQIRHYNANGSLREVIGPYTRSAIEYNDAGWPVRQTETSIHGNPSERVTCWRRRQDGTAREVVDPLGAAWSETRAYSGNDLNTTVWVSQNTAQGCAQGSSLEGSQPPPPVIATVEQRDGADRVVAQRDAAGAWTRFSYDGFGRLASVGDDAGTTVHTRYDARHRPIARIVNQGAALPGQVNASNLGSIRELLSAAFVTYAPDGGLAMRQTFAKGPNGTEQVSSERLHRNLAGRWTTRISETPVGNVTWKQQWDGLGRTIALTNGLDDVLSIAYPSATTRVLNQRSPDGQPIVVSEELDDFGGVLRQTDSKGQMIVERDVDALGRTVHERAPGKQTDIEYNAWSQVRSITHRAAGGDKQGYLVRAHEFDAQGQLTAVFLGNQETVRFAHDHLGRVVRETRAGRTTVINYVDASSLVSFQKQPSARTLRYEYDDARKLLSAITADATAAADVVGALKQRVQFAYDALGQLEQSTVQAGGPTVWTTEQRRDGVGRLRREAAGTLPAVLLDYDLGLPMTRQTIGSQVFNFDRRRDGRLTGIRSPQGLLAAFAYQGAGPAAQITYGNGVIQQQTFDYRGRITAQQLGAELGLTYQYGTDGNTRKASMEGSWHQDALDLVLDPVGRVKTESLAVHGEAARSSSYNVDLADNWSHVLRKGKWLQTRPDASHAYAVVPDGDASYDADGRQLSVGPWRYRYDAFGRLAEARNDNGPVCSYDYDALGRRVREVCNGQETLFGYSGDNLVVEKTADSTLATLHAGLSAPVVRFSLTDLQNPTYLLTGKDGSVRAVMDQAGQVVETYAYTAFGETTVKQRPGYQPTGNRFGFHGHYRDPMTGLVQMRARYYAPGWGRFLTPDPLGEALTGNPYAFVGNRPGDYWDPFGLSPVANPNGRSVRDNRFDAYRDTGQLTSSPGDNDPGYYDGLWGASYGMAQSFAPGGAMVPSPYPQSRDFEIGRAAGLYVGGACQILAGGGATVAGGGVTVASGGAGAVVGAPVAVWGTAATANGVLSVGMAGNVLVSVGPGSGVATTDAARGAGGKADDVLHVTPDGVALPKGPKHKIPDGYVENPHRPGSYGEMVDGKFKERLRIDPATPPGRKGPNHSHYHRDGKGTHYSPAPGDKDPGFQP